MKQIYLLLIAVALFSCKNADNPSENSSTPTTYEKPGTDYKGYFEGAWLMVEQIERGEYAHFVNPKNQDAEKIQFRKTDDGDLVYCSIFNSNLALDVNKYKVSEYKKVLKTEAMKGDEFHLTLVNIATGAGLNVTFSLVEGDYSNRVEIGGFWGENVKKSFFREDQNLKFVLREKVVN